jgi:hypothetical protein
MTYLPVVLIGGSIQGQNFDSRQDGLELNAQLAGTSFFCAESQFAGNNDTRADGFVTDTADLFLDRSVGKTYDFGDDIRIE